MSLLTNVVVKAIHRAARNASTDKTYGLTLWHLEGKTDFLYSVALNEDQLQRVLAIVQENSPSVTKEYLVEKRSRLAEKRSKIAEKRSKNEKAEAKE
jgi:hypothetical protein